jgi:hypothetical protein
MKPLKKGTSDKLQATSEYKYKNSQKRKAISYKQIQNTNTAVSYKLQAASEYKIQFQAASCKRGVYPFWIIKQA